MIKGRKFIIGFIGTGLMGEPIAKHILDHYKFLAIWNRTKEKAESLLKLGAVWCENPKELANLCDIIILCLTDQNACNEILFSINGVIKASKPKIIIDHSTLAPNDARKISKELSREKFQYIDAPVTGSVPGAKSGKLVIFTSGQKSTFEFIKPILQVYSCRITYFGKNSLGQSAKLCNQIMLHNTILATFESLRFAQLQGLDTEVLLSSLHDSLIDSKAWRIFSEAALNPNSTKLANIKDMLKDLRYIESNLNGEFAVTRSVISELIKAVDLGHGLDCVSTLFKK